MTLRRVLAVDDPDERARLVLEWFLDAEVAPLSPERPDRADLPRSLAAALDPSDGTAWGRFERVLHWIWGWAGARLDAEYEDGAGAAELLDRFTPLTGRPAATGEVFDRWWVGERVLAQMSPHSNHFVTMPPTVTIVGRHRADVEAELTPAEVARGRWRRLERIMEPDSDFVFPPDRAWTFPAREMTGDLGSVISVSEPMQSLERFVWAWYGLSLPEPQRDVDKPEAHDRLLRLDRVDEVFHDGHLLDDSDPDRAVGIVPEKPEVRIWAECQFLDIASYSADVTGPDPEVLLRTESEVAPPIEGRPTVAELLLRKAIDEALWHSPFRAQAEVDPSQVERLLEALDELLPARPLLPAVHAVGSVLVELRWDQRELPDHPVLLRAAAHSREAIAASPLAEVGGWTWTYGTARSPVDSPLDWMVDNDESAEFDLSHWLGTEPMPDPEGEPRLRELLGDAWSAPEGDD